MTCQELHCYLENPLRVEIYMYRESLPATVSEHLAECGECARLFEEQKALGISLNMARDAAPPTPASLDAKVLANYRRQMAEPESPSHRGAWSASNPWLRWGVAAAVVIAVVATAVFLGQRNKPVTAKEVAPIKEHIPVAVQQQETVVPANRLPVESPKQEASAERTRSSFGAANKSPLPPGFASLMYCDELNCTGAMEVIRVELPTAVGQPNGPSAAPVMAEVLVGADGIARGIRIVQ